MDTKECAQCGRTFEKPRTVSRRVWADRQFCSRKCFGAAQGIKQRRLPDRECGACGRVFRPASFGRMYCSPECAYGRINYARGERHPSWKGGRVSDPSGYVRVRMGDDHPLVAMRLAHGYVLEHRLVMAEHLGRALRRDETVHHRNGRRDDNRLENLELRSGRHGAGAAMCCARCGSTDLVPVG